MLTAPGVTWSNPLTTGDPKLLPEDLALPKQTNPTGHLSQKPGHFLGRLPAWSLDPLGSDSELPFHISPPAPQNAPSTPVTWHSSLISDSPLAACPLPRCCLGPPLLPGVPIPIFTTASSPFLVKAEWDHVLPHRSPTLVPGGTHMTEHWANDR